MVNAREQSLVDNARRPFNWEILKALESMSPPSPSPSLGSDFMASLSSVGEIPIILDSGLIGEDFEPGSPPISRYPLSPREIQSSSNLSDAIESPDLFGSSRRAVQLPRSPSLSASSPLSTGSIDSGLVAFGYSTPLNQSAQFLSPRQEEGFFDRRPGVTSSYTISSYLSPSLHRVASDTSSWSLAGSTSSARASPNQSPWNSPSPSLGTSLSTIIFAAGTASGSPSITEALGFTARQNMYPSDSSSTVTSRIDFPRCSSPLVDSPIRATFERPSSPAPPLVLDETVFAVREGPRIRTKSSATTKSSKSTQSNSSQRTCVAGPAPEFPITKVPGLPPVLSWLENVRLELWIDQEGFRLIRPVFKLSAFTNSCPFEDDRDVELVNTLTYGSADFRPTECQPFVFHHSPLDPPPTLRKITMEGDDTRDYLSRQASLAIKSNGVYSVSGSSSFDSGPPSPRAHSFASSSTASQEPLKLTWRFEYMVDDCHVEGTGKVRPGEKVLSPLSFSCSPGLLHPTQGKKIKVMHVVKKGLIPKLSSAKMKTSPSPLQIHVHEHVGDDGDSASLRKVELDRDWSPKKSNGLDKHRRAFSSSVETLTESPDRSRSCSNSEGGGLKKSKVIQFTPPSRLRDERPPPIEVPLPGRLTERQNGQQRRRRFATDMN